MNTPTVKIFDDDRYWYDMAEEYGFGRTEHGAELIRALYRLWEPLEKIKFSEFINIVKAESTFPNG